MKHRFNYNSIKFKTWLYFILFAAFLMLAIWLLQVFFLNNFYSAMKNAQTKSVAQDLKSSYRQHSEKRFLSEVNKISKSYDMYIYIVSYDGKTTYFNPENTENWAIPDSYSSMRFDDEISVLNKKIITSGEGTVSLTFNESPQDTGAHGFSSPGGKKQLLAYGGILSYRDKAPMIVYIFSPLWPISSTIKILTNQLVYVTIISLVLACIISLYLSVRITRPIRKITLSAERLANGEYGIVFRGGHYTELVKLADTLTDASIKLEKTEAMHKNLIANVSHDLRTPLTMIKSYAEMIHDISGDNPEKRREHLQVIMDESDRLNSLVSDLLAISRLQSGKMTIQRSPFDLTETVRTVLKTYRIMEEEEGLDFRFSCPTEFIVDGDEEKIKQVISNFVTNAMKFCGSDKVVEVSLKRKGRVVACRVSDHGAGIPPDDLDHIWERYYQSSSNTVRSKDGSGLGLSICKEILTLHKSEFGVDSTLGSGSSFWFGLDFIRTEKRKVQTDGEEE